MLTRNPRITESVERQYTVGRDLAFTRIMAEYGEPVDDDALAELIEADGRARIALRLPVPLARYLDAVRDLTGRTVPLDAAIDVALRSMSAAPRPSSEAVETLVSDHPDLAGPIREAAALAEAVWSTTGLRSNFRAPAKQLPCEFGPHLPSGECRYQLRSLLGSGGWGDVYLAADRQLSDSGHEALVAIKVLAGADRGPWARQKLIDEATKARRVGHANVVRVLDRGVSADDEDFVVYEHIAGGDLADWIKNRKVTAREAAALMTQISRGVQAAHAAGLVHCDLKPGNVLMTPDGQPRVADFGIAVRAADGASPDGRDDGQPVGNIAFIAPEQFRMEEGCFSVAADVYALGGMLYFLASGVLPNGATPREIEATHDRLNGRSVPPSLVKSGAGGADLAAICGRAMAAAPDQRHASAAALADDLDAWLKREPIHWTRPGLVKRTGLWCRRRPTVAGALAVALLAAGVGTAFSVHWSDVATKKTAEAKSATGTLENTRNAVGNLLKFTRSASKAGRYQDILPPEALMEWMNAGKLLGDPRNRKPHLDRIAAVKNAIQERNDQGYARSVETRMWETILGLYYLDIKRYDDAEPLLQSCRAAWVEAQRGDDDPWLAQIDRLINIARAQRFIAHAEGRALSPAEREGLLTAAGVLRQVLDVDPAQLMHGCVTELAISTLVEAYGPALLNDPDGLAAAKARDRRRPVGPPPPSDKARMLTP